MIETSSPTVWRRWLAFEIKRMRQKAGLSQAAVAMAIGSQVPKVSLIESGQRNIREKDLDKLLRLFEVPEHLWDDYFTAAKRAHEKGWWEIYDDEHTLPDWLQQFIGLEQGAQRLRTYEPAVFPGLLQIPEYAYTVLHGTSPAFSQAKIERLVEVRIRRQEALLRDNKPLRFSAIVDEAVLRRVVGNSEIMRSQLQHVTSVVRQYDNIGLQVVPFSGGGAYEATYGAFAILTFGWLTDPGVVYLERPSNAEFLESLAGTDEYSVLFQRLCDLALSPSQSVEMLQQTVARLS